MAINWNMHNAKRFVGSCSICRESISSGYYYRNGSAYRHSACHKDPAAHAPVAAPVIASAPVALDPELARALAPHLRAGRIPTYGGPERHGRTCGCPDCDYEREGR